ncbi:YggS family pyridoxal phosphate-dependent enzyme [Wenyingzhuangia sp. 2_MG-2023]|uniref:YggS family pyridoxal phosphate-dependent enzyme n=1 Tax=Wenyingzhuangia sp. 2_MG-2023 TaxID=3062639 RepID=UPI0026E1BB1F|nr:YggS family pyridoxal phosphate-dependent enzyme [Wenyingzhuangia sp. 2_MG-2023]MDO6738273.1 YggS family pyridoxal phosphate-dependent enzyme [Wenyingzhuangia sp. 2_MG-2023]
MTISQNLTNIQKTIPKGVTLVAVSKTKPVSDIQEAYDAGQRVFGENKIQEMVAKYDELPKDISWHMIGHLQSNKVKYMAHFVDLIHGIDSFSTLQEINKQAKKHNRIINCLLQYKIAQEDSKFGLSQEEINNILNSYDYKNMENIKIVGLMGMASFVDDEIQIREEFKSLKIFYDQLKDQHTQFSTISMGMSGDYPLAIQEGSNMIRVGSAIFGNRNYTK